MTTVERLVEFGLRAVVSDRNAAQELARFGTVDELEQLIDWELMTTRIWNNTTDEPDRMDRRMAECLVHHRVPWRAFIEVVVRSDSAGVAAAQVLTTVGRRFRFMSDPAGTSDAWAVRR